MLHRFIDISWPLQSESVSYKNRHPITIETVRTVAAHGITDSRCISLHMHAGTHIDAPSHCIAGGLTVEQLSLAAMNGTCRILDLGCVVRDCIEADDLKQFEICAGERILLKTRNSSMPAVGAYNPHEVYLAASGAQYLAQCGVILVGVDGLGLERNQEGYPSHCALFNAGIIVVEGLRLALVDPLQNYTLHILPLAFRGTDAAPARAVLSF
jgi:arylformamidase